MLHLNARTFKIFILFSTPAAASSRSISALTAGRLPSTILLTCHFSRLIAVLVISFQMRIDHRAVLMFAEIKSDQQTTVELIRAFA